MEKHKIAEIVMATLVILFIASILLWILKVSFRGDYSNMPGSQGRYFDVYDY